MPRSTREWAQRKLDMVKGNIDTSLVHVEEVRETYVKEHPSLALHMDNLQILLVGIDECVNKLKIKF